jgi:hypothetical protein
MTHRLTLTLDSNNPVLNAVLTTLGRRDEKRLQELYGNRSVLAHAGKGEQITGGDLNRASMILRFAIEKLAELAKSGYIQLAKR